MSELPKAPAEYSVVNPPLIQTVILPNGVRIEGAVEYLDHKCLICDESAIRFHVPKYVTFDAHTDEQWCLTHIVKFWDIAKKVNEDVRAEMAKPFRPWNRKTWWRVKTWRLGIRRKILTVRLFFIKCELWVLKWIT